jgi:AAA family ATP:ADP antiporter
MTASSSSPDRTVLERALGLVTSVRRAEVPTALLLTLDSFLLLTAYGCIKPAREALILSLPTGAEYKVYMSAAIAAVLLVAVPLYAKVAVRLTRNRLVIGVTAFFASQLAASYASGSAYGSTVPLALGVYLWIGVFDLMVVAQFWAFANDIYSEEAGQRLFPLIGLGASLGAAAGSGLAGALIPRIGTMATLLVAAALLLLTAVITQLVHARETNRAQGPPSSMASARLGDGRGDAVIVFVGAQLMRWPHGGAGPGSLHHAPASRAFGAEVAVTTLSTGRSIATIRRPRAIAPRAGVPLAAVRSACYVLTVRMRLLLCLLLVGCSSSSYGPDEPRQDGPEIGVYCPGPRSGCHQRAEQDCFRRFGTTRYQVVGEVPGRSILVVTCGAADSSW